MTRRVVRTPIDEVPTTEWHPAAKRVVQEFEVLRTDDDLARLVNEIVSQGGTPAMQEEIARIIRKHLETLVARRLRFTDRVQRVKRALAALTRRHTAPRE